MMRTNRGRHAGRLALVLALGAAAVVPVGGLAATAAEANRFEMAAVEMTKPDDDWSTSPNLESQTIGSVEMVRIEILHSLDEADAVALVESGGGIIEGTAAGRLVQALYPADAIAELAETAGVETVRRPTLLEPAPRADVPADLDLDGLSLQAAIRGQEVGKTKASAWHAAGFTGAGVRVGIIDAFSIELWEAAMSAGDLPDYSGAFSSINGSTSTAFPDAGIGGGFHGVGVAEIVHEMAPDAELYVVTAITAADLQAAVNYLDAQGVDIITRSQGAIFDGPGDGTGVLADVQRDAISKGMVWLNSAGNHAGPVGEGSYWRSGWVDVDVDGWLDFSGGASELMAATCGFFQGLRWSDWGNSRTDYDLYVFEDLSQASIFDPNNPATYKASSVLDQTAGADPIETPDWACSDGDVDYFAIFRFGGGSSNGDVLEIAMNAAQLQFSSNPYSAGQPFSDSNVAGALSVGAVDPAAGAAIGSYSSRGPSNDGRIKPDVSAASCVDGFAFNAVGLDCFNGTSAATPAVAGALALVYDSGLATSPAALHSWLLNNALVDRGPAGSDNSFGHGEVILPAPPADFTDDDESVFEADIQWLAEQGITQGCNPPDNDRFCPNDAVTRGQMAAFLRRALPGLALSGSFDFRDDDDSVFQSDIEWLARAGVTRGCNPPDNDRFCPEDAVTRGQMAAFLRRAVPDLATSGSFEFDDDNGSVFESDIEWLARAGVTRGCNPPDNDEFCPDDVVTRGQMAAFLRRALTG